MLETLETLVYVLVLAVISAATIRDRLANDPTPEQRRQERLDELAAKRARGEIDATEHEQEVEFVLDERNHRIRTVVEDVNRVGPDTSKAIAREFESLDDLRGADRDRLEGVPGVGEELTDAILDRVRDE